MWSPTTGRRAALLAAVLWVRPAWAGPVDSDGDGVCDLEEDRNGNGLLDDDTDGDGTPDGFDPDDDDDGIPTADEDWDGDGDPTNDDLNDNGRADYLEDNVPLDVDRDGYVSADWGGDDCNDFSTVIHPGAFDPWYDGADWDCAGDDDYDADRDGYSSAVNSPDGDDCDDQDPTIFPGAPETVDPADRDCDGWTDPARPLYPVGGCDCDTGGPGPGLAGLLLLVALRRRR